MTKKYSVFDSDFLPRLASGSDNDATKSFQNRLSKKMIMNTSLNKKSLCSLNNAFPGNYSALGIIL